jgi:hypothetical protein
MNRNQVDVKENDIYRLDIELLDILLKDHSSGKNIIWATDNYASRGYGYQSYDYITVQSVTGYNGNVVKPRVEKSKKEQTERIKQKAEVFTPSWICNKQNNLVDNAWFGEDFVFNTENEKTWTSNKEKIPFPTPTGKTWQDYVSDTRLEITCGEAPYLASRYDTVSGEYISVESRVGLLDRKLRVVSENTDSEEEALHLLKYVKSKFARIMLGILKVTQGNKAETWEYVPTQDFTSHSDIDWSKTISDIDKQLYSKYGLTPEEIAFIEAKVEPME